MSIGLKRKK